jgi:hypothetical protein
LTVKERPLTRARHHSRLQAAPAASVNVSRLSASRCAYCFLSLAISASVAASRLAVRLAIRCCSLWACLRRDSVVAVSSTFRKRALRSLAALIRRSVCFFNCNKPASAAPAGSAYRALAARRGGGDRNNAEPNQGDRSLSARPTLWIAVFQTRSPAHAQHTGLQGVSKQPGRALWEGDWMSVCRAVLTSKLKVICSEPPRGKKVQDRNLCRRQEAGGVSCYTSAINKNEASSARNGTRKATSVPCSSKNPSQFSIGPMMPAPSKAHHSESPRKRLWLLGNSTSLFGVHGN